MNAQALKLSMVAQFEQSIIQLADQGARLGNLFIVAVGDDFPMPVNFNAKGDNWWSDIEGATKWEKASQAKVYAATVVNGHNQVGKVMMIDEYVTWHTAQLETLIQSLKA